MDMDVETAPLRKKPKGEKRRTISDVRWEAGFAQGIIYSWKNFEKKPLKCGCWLLDPSITRCFYTLLTDLDTKFYDRDVKKIMAPLIQYLKNKHYLLDGTHKGLITPGAISTSPTPIHPILLNYNAFAESLNLLHNHDFTEYEVPYYS